MLLDTLTSGIPAPICKARFAQLARGCHLVTTVDRPYTVHMRLNAQVRRRSIATARHRRITDEGPQDRWLPRRRIRRRIFAWPHPGPARAAADVPAKYKSEPWARLGVNVDADFEPLYIVSPDKKGTVTELKGLLKDVDELYLATDGDREGEAIAWHLLETLKPKVPVRRMVFHEITEQAILAAAQDPRDLDNNLVDAQETRRILDRLYGYEVSPVLWKKVGRNLSAGRVQSVATRIIVQRERDRMAFRSAGYWDLGAELDAGKDNPAAKPHVFMPGWSAWTPCGWPRAATSTRWARSRRPVTARGCWSSMRPAPTPWSQGCRRRR